MWGIAAPRIAVTGLNPHAGENGHLGAEEIDVIQPALDAARAAGMLVAVRYPADTLFVPRHLRTSTACWPCTTTRACRYSSTPASATASTSRWDCPSYAPRSTMALRSTWRGTGRADAGSLIAATQLAIEFAARSG